MCVTFLCLIITKLIMLESLHEIVTDLKIVPWQILTEGSSNTGIMSTSYSSMFPNNELCSSSLRDIVPPICLKKLSRSPRDIFEKKAEMEKSSIKVDRAFSDTLLPLDEVLENEIRLKLMYLDIIRKQKQDKNYLSTSEVDKLVEFMNKLDYDKKQAFHVIALRDYKITILEHQLEELRRAVLDVKTHADTEVEDHRRVTQILKDELRICREQLTGHFPEISANTLTCSRFNPKLDVSGQVLELCQGVYGSEWVVDMLKTRDIASSKLV